jgi:adenylylsulfate kinase (EC 2.7.1.25)/sulfate adenylyltransferase (EC 2.7.7.4)
MTEADYNGVVENMRLADGALWSMPIVLDVPTDYASDLKVGDSLALRDKESVIIATIEISDIYRPDKQNEAKKVYGSDDDLHAGVKYLFDYTHDVYIGGKLKGVTTHEYYDFRHLRFSPQELRDQFKKLGWRKIVAFQTRNPMHRAHIELARSAASMVEANLLIHPVVGPTKPGDVDYFTRVRCYEHVINRFPEQTTMLSLLPLAMRMAGPREALWHAIIRKNHGCTHFIIGRDHAGPGKDKNGVDFYGPYDAQELVEKHKEELDITPVTFKNMVYVEEKAQYIPEDEVTENDTAKSISGTEFRRRLKEGLEVEEWFSYPEVIAELRRTFPPRKEQGVTLFFTGLSGSGKSTIANALVNKLMEIGTRKVTLLDGDVVRTNLSSELGFSEAHRNLNIQRIGYVASEILSMVALLFVRQSRRMRKHASRFVKRLKHKVALLKSMWQRH